MTIATSLLVTASDPRFDAAMRIYREAIEPSEQKPQKTLRRQVGDPRFHFLVAESAGAVIGFAIVFIPPTRDFWLLEYMAVDASARSSGIGSKLFDAAVQFAAENTDGAPGILEVDAPDRRLPPDSPIRRRLSFYARKGCRVIDGLQYILPPLQGTAPPPMMLLVQGVPEQSAFERSAVQRWLAALYIGVYGQAADDARIGRMVAPLPDRVGLASISSLL